MYQTGEIPEGFSIFPQPVIDFTRSFSLIDSDRNVYVCTGFWMGISTPGRGVFYMPTQPDVPFLDVIENERQRTGRFQMFGTEYVNIDGSTYSEEPSSAFGCVSEADVEAKIINTEKAKRLLRPEIRTPRFLYRFRTANPANSGYIYQIPLPLTADEVLMSSYENNEPFLNFVELSAIALRRLHDGQLVHNQVHHGNIYMTTIGKLCLADFETLQSIDKHSRVKPKDGTRLSPWNAAKQGDLTSILGIHINRICTRLGLTGGEEEIRVLINRFRHGYGIAEGLSVMQFDQLSDHSVAFKEEMRADVVAQLRKSM